MPLGPDKMLYAVSFCETLDEALSVFFNTTLKIAGNAHIERPIALARQNIDPASSHVPEVAASGSPGQARR